LAKRAGDQSFFKLIIKMASGGNGLPDNSLHDKEKLIELIYKNTLY